MYADTLGICCQELALLPPAKATATLEAIAAFGFEHVRFEVPWGLVEPSKGKWTWGPTSYNWAPAAGIQLVANTARKLGLTLLPVLGVHMPTWAWNASHFGEFTRRAHGELGSVAWAYEVMNEMNFGNFAFGRQSRASDIVPLIREAKANIFPHPIVFGGMAAVATASGWTLAPVGPFGMPWPVSYRNQRASEYLADARIAGLGQAADLIGYHPYSIGPGFDEQPPSNGQLMIAEGRKLGPQTRLATEWGFPISLGATEAAKRFEAQLPIVQADYARSYLFAWMPGVGGDYGLVDANGKPRQPLFDTVKAALT